MGATIVNASRPCFTCKAQGHAEVYALGWKTDGQTHVVIAPTTRTLCRHDISQTEGTIANAHSCIPCLFALADLQPTAPERARWDLP